MNRQRVNAHVPETVGLPLFDGMEGAPAPSAPSERFVLTDRVIDRSADGVGSDLKIVAFHDDGVEAEAKVAVARPLTLEEAEALVNGEAITAALSAPYSNPTTSREAAQSIEPQLGNLEELVLEAIRASRDGLTCDEVEEFTKLSHQCASARVNGLMKRGVIVDSGRKRKTRSGRNAIVWIEKAKA